MREYHIFMAYTCKYCLNCDDICNLAIFYFHETIKKKAKKFDVMPPFTFKFAININISCRVSFFTGKLLFCLLPQHLSSSLEKKKDNSIKFTT